MIDKMGKVTCFIAPYLEKYTRELFLYTGIRCRNFNDHPVTASFLYKEFISLTSWCTPLFILTYIIVLVIIDLLSSLFCNLGLIFFGEDYG